MLRLGVDIVGLGKGDSQGGVAIDLPQSDFLQRRPTPPNRYLCNVMLTLLNV